MRGQKFRVGEAENHMQTLNPLTPFFRSIYLHPLVYMGATEWYPGET